MAKAKVEGISAERLSGVLSTLVPGGDGFPSAGSPNICEAMMADAAVDNEIELVTTTLSKLLADFERQNEAKRVTALERLQASEPRGFAALLRHTYHAYYTAPEVRDVLEALDGYPARPPHYAGYELEAFDVESLAVQKKRKPFWRSA